jgi:hypothetical protein
MSTHSKAENNALGKKEDGHYAAVIKGGAIGGTVGLAIGLGGVYAASRRWPAFRQLTLPFRTFLVTSTATFGAIVNADHYSTAFARAQDPKAGYRDMMSRARSEARENASWQDRAMDWGKDNRYKIVMASWLASMGIAFFIVNRAPMSTSQKVVQARVYAQGLTLAVLILSAAFEMNDAKKGNSRWQTIKELDPTDPEHKRMIEKRIHQEEYEGQDLWMDMVAAEERRIKERKAAEAQKQAQAEQQVQSTKA